MEEIQIALVGLTPEAITAGLRFKKADKIYLLHSKETLKYAEKLDKDLSAVGYAKIYLEEINPFELNSTVYKIIEIKNKEVNNNISINITGGTNLMAGAATSAAYFCGASAFYVLFDKKNKQSTGIYELPIPNLPYFKNLNKEKREILTFVSKKGQVKQIDIARDLGKTPQAISRHLKTLKRMKFVNIEENGREKIVNLTNEGKLVISWAN
jgi:CRISPR locus-related DNA-binding protein